MLEVLTARSGEEVLSVAGRSTASVFSPRDEAERWISSQQLRGPGVDLICLGAGSGYHLIHLLELMTPDRILVIEKYSEVVSWVQAKFPELSALNFVSGLEAEELLASPMVADWLTRVFDIVEFRASVQLSPIFYGRARNELLGRFRASFERQIAARPEYRVPPEGIELPMDLGEVISVRTMLSFIDSNQSVVDVRERRIWKLLGELIV